MTKDNIPGRTDPNLIRNFCIIAHIDHGKSTLADRMLQLTNIVDQRNMRAQYLDKMDIERERGITIKSQAVRMPWEKDGITYELNMIDTPGHVDFTYEVSRSLAACEATILLVDSTQGIEAQTLANLYLAIENDLTIIPVLNKIDLPAAKPDYYAEEIANLIGIDKEEILYVSAKTGEGVKEVLDRIVEVTPPPENHIDEPARALIFDSEYDIYRGVVTYIKMVSGELTERDMIRFLSTNSTHDLLEIGTMSPEPTKAHSLRSGEVGYLITGIKDVSQSKVGDTITIDGMQKYVEPLAGYKEPQSVVFSGIYPIDGDDYDNLRDALDKLKLNDAALTFEPETSAALGFGFRAGFLGLLHLEIIMERLEREFDLNLISTVPNVIYKVKPQGGEETIVKNPSEFPYGKIEYIKEPLTTVTILTPTEYIGTVIDLCQKNRGTQVSMEYLSTNRVQLVYKIPLAQIIINFFDSLKSRTKGYASLEYEIEGEQTAELERIDILLNGNKVDAFSSIVHKDQAYEYGARITEKLKDIIPRQQFSIPIQAAIGSKIIARETVKAYRKDVTTKCYGGDITRKRKLLEKQKEGKKRMKKVGNVEVPPDAFIKILSDKD